MNKVLRDNSFALILGGLCLALSAVLYFSEPREPPNLASSVAANPAPVQTRNQAQAPTAIPRAGANSQASAQTPRRDPLAQQPKGDPGNGPARPDLDDYLSPADWRASTKQ